MPPKVGKNLKKKQELKLKDTEKAKNVSEVSLTYIDALEDFLQGCGPSKTEAGDQSSLPTDFESVTNAFENCVTNLTATGGNKSEIIMKLKGIQNLITIKINCLESGDDDKVRQWMDGNKAAQCGTGDDAKSTCTRDTDSESVTSSVKIANLRSIVNCQFCDAPASDLSKLALHLTECQRLQCNNFKTKNNYSYYQILSNNSIKCNLCPKAIRNLGQKFQHDRSRSHADNVKLRQKDGKKPVANTGFLFCACCKMVVPDNFTQFQAHIMSGQHRGSSDNQPKIKDLVANGTLFLINANDSIHCGVCRFTFPCGSDNLAGHMLEEAHQNKTREQAPALLSPFPHIYCFSCETDVKDSGTHIQSWDHKKSRSRNDKKTVCCVFCGAEHTLLDLATHCKTACRKLNTLRKTLQSAPATVEQHQVDDYFGSAPTAAVSDPAAKVMSYFD